jgi:hypothetical protein
VLDFTSPSLNLLGNKLSAQWMGERIYPRAYMDAVDESLRRCRVSNLKSLVV